MRAIKLHRIVPMRGSDAQRIISESAGKILPGEFYVTTQGRLFLDGVFVGPAVWHGIVADQAGMLALNTSSSRGCFPGDECKRGDTLAIWRCISNRGALLTDWIERGSGGGGSTDIRTVWLKG